MQEWILTPQELLYCAAQTGAQRFFGIDDPFYAMEPEEIRAAIPRLQQSLEQKGVARLGFDDSFALVPQVAALMDICTGCTGYLLLKCTQQQTAHTVRVYWKEDKAVIATDTQGGIALAETPVQTLAEQLTQLLPDAGTDGETGETIRLTYALLSEVQKKAADDAAAARQLLMDQGATEDLAQRLVHSFSDATRAVLCKCDLQRRSLDTAVLLFDRQGVVCMLPADVEEQIWQVKPLSREDTKAVVAEFLQEVAGQ